MHCKKANFWDSVFQDPTYPDQKYFKERKRKKENKNYLIPLKKKKKINNLKFKIQNEHNRIAIVQQF